MWGHDESNCWGQCQNCHGWGHKQSLCPTINQNKIEKIKARKARTKAKSKAKKATKKANKKEANFHLDLPDGFDDYSDDDSVVTVVSPEDRVKEKQDRPKD